MLSFGTEQRYKEFLFILINREYPRQQQPEPFSLDQRPNKHSKAGIDRRHSQMAKNKVPPSAASPSASSTTKSTINPTEKPLGDVIKLPIVHVLGLTGAGKTTFINHVTGSKLAVGKGMAACTTMSTYEVGVIDCTEVAFVDTTGFDDPQKSDADILIDVTS